VVGAIAGALGLGGLIDARLRAGVMQRLVGTAPHASMR
jgi:hypothetical protein